MLRDYRCTPYVKRTVEASVDWRGEGRAAKAGEAQG